MSTIHCADPGVPWAALIEPPTLDALYLPPILDCLVKVNLVFLHRHRAPALYRSGVRYVEDGVGTERWKAIPHVLAAGSADCKSLAAYRVAELVHAGERARATFSSKLTPEGILYHVFVIRGNGQREDPSRILGMRP